MRQLPLLLASAGVVGCGGGDATAGATRTTLQSFEISPATLAAPSSGTVALSARWTYEVEGATGGVYTLQFHVMPEGSTTAPGDANRVLNRNCSAALPCSSPHTESCSFDGRHALVCGASSSRVLAPGRYTVVGRVCAFDASLADVCGQLQRPLIVE